MVSRILAQPGPRAPRHRPLVLAGAALAVALVLALILVGSPSSTPSAGALVLSAGLQGSAQFITAGPAPPGEIALPRPRYVFRPGPGLSRTATTGVGYALVAPPDKEALLQRLALIFKVSGQYAAPRPGHRYYALGTTRGATMYFASDDHVPTWGYVRGPCEVNASYQGPLTGCPLHPWRPHAGEARQSGRTVSQGAMDAKSLSYSRRLGSGFTAAVDPITSQLPRFTEPNYAYCGHLCVYFSVVLDLYVHGVLSPTNIGFTYNQAGELVAASGSAVSVGAATSYNLISQAAGVTLVNRYEQSLPPGYEPVPPNPKVAAEFRREARHKVIVHGVLTSVRLSYGLYLTASHRLVGLPVYTYSGYLIEPRCCHRGGVQHEPWTMSSVLAVKPSLVRFTNPFS